MPEAAINKNGSFIFFEDEIGLSEQPTRPRPA